MFVLDVNVLVAAYRSDHPDHDAVLPWWQRFLQAAERFVVPDTVWVGFTRIVTNRRIFEVPATVAEAAQFVRAVTAQPGYTSPLPDPGLLTAWLDTCMTGQAAGDLLPDAYIAAVAQRLGATVVTRDRDFRRFDDLRLLDPA